MGSTQAPSSWLGTGLADAEGCLISVSGGGFLSGSSVNNAVVDVVQAFAAEGIHTGTSGRLEGGRIHFCLEERRLRERIN